MFMETGGHKKRAHPTTTTEKGSANHQHDIVFVSI